MEINVSEGKDLFDIADKTGAPSLEIRAVNPFLQVDAFNDPKSWYYDEEYWKTYP